jgi:nucleotide-binding universal stress UspA family protein
MSQHSGVIVVGVDGSPQGDAALAFALQEAARWGDAVHVVTAWHVDLPAMSYPTLPQAGTLPSRSELKAHAEDIQRRTLERAGVPGDVPVSTDVVEGLAGHALVEAARDARLLVVGSRTVGEIRAVLLASVSRYCAHHATCPVVVVPDVRRDPSDERDAAPTTVRTASSM